MIDRHVGRQTRIFNLEGDPEKFLELIDAHGVLARIMKARKCPCSEYGSPSMYCELCHGDGNIYEFQRKFKQVDENSPCSDDGHIIYPYRIPILKPLKVERLLPDVVGGIRQYDIEDYTDNEITISGAPLPKQYEMKRVSYYFDKFEYVEKEYVQVDGKIITTEQTRYDDRYKSSNHFGVYGDIVIVKKIYDEMTSHEFTNYTFRKNKIYLNDTEPEPTPGKTYVEYYYIRPTKVLPQDIMIRFTKEKWMSDLGEGECRIAIEPWYEIAEGDIITFLTPSIFKNETVVHNVGSDKLLEFDVERVDDIIYDEDGGKFYEGSDFVLKNFNDLIWIGNQPEQGKNINIRYSFHPTYIVYIDNAMPNTLENKLFPLVVSGKVWQKTMHKDIEIHQQEPYNFQVAE